MTDVQQKETKGKTKVRTIVIEEEMTDDQQEVTRRKVRVMTVEETTGVRRGEMTDHQETPLPTD